MGQGAAEPIKAQESPGEAAPTTKTSEIGKFWNCKEAMRREQSSRVKAMNEKLNQRSMNLQEPNGASEGPLSTRNETGSQGCCQSR